jgi:hypothetical protein
MSNSPEMLMQKLSNIKQLMKIMKDMDPASGVSFMVRRGVARDNPENDDDDEIRPWVTVETAELDVAKTVIEQLVLAEKQSAKFWADSTRRTIKECEQALCAFDSVKK